MLTEKQCASLHQVIVSLILQFEEVVAKAQERAMEPVQDGNWSPNDQATVLSERACASEELARMSERLRALCARKEAIERGKFDGLCEECGDPIGFRRLTANPTACCCASCAQEREIRARMVAGGMAPSY